MKFKSILAVSLLALAAPGHAVNVIWADWTSSTSSTVTGSLATTTPISITFSTSGESLAFAQTVGGTNYWTEPNALKRPYTGGSVSNAPPGTDIIALSAGGTKTISFGQPISGLYIALVSWNGNVVSFNQPFTKISEGDGYWGGGSFNSGSSNFVGVGEPHGILYFGGTFSSLSFTDTSENWHGLTVGVEQLASETGVPEPSTWAMMIAGFGIAGFMLRAARRSVAFA